MTDRISSLVIANEDVAAAYEAVMHVAPTPSELHYVAEIVRRAVASAKRPPEPAPGPYEGHWPARLHDKPGVGHGLGALPPAFRRGLRTGLHPHDLEDVTAISPPNADVTVIRLLGQTVEVSGLEQMQASDLEALGREKGSTLRQAQGKPWP